ncbi:hypothetical protein E2L08_14480 [Palleronia sediminis]|uniref:Trifunctional nucleotide phosphoesterase protein YfkN n=1 Tax=Palleronia sediminis TaxID=2547833 RepID=A0A4R6A5I9_9RHOB|nr:5'-nucleotidase C-terminal domain-containing protein [Palleronia sediminis]TDL76033.1 hypothetical protein E2L08_14480 [Palleronia sediminis]
MRNKFSDGSSRGVRPKGAAVDLRIIATCDLHGHARSFDYAARRFEPDFGLERAAGLIERLRGEAANSILLDAGDFLSGSLMSEIAGPTNIPVLAAMNALGFDAAALGNHDLDFGCGSLDAIQRQAAFPILSANLDFGAAAGPVSLPGTALLSPRMRDRDGTPVAFRIGVFGLLHPGALAGHPEAARGAVSVGPMRPAFDRASTALREAGADLVICLCHDGLHDDDSEIVDLAQGGGADAFVLGHTHRIFPGPAHAATARIDPRNGIVAGKPAIQAGFWGRHVGVIDLRIEMAAPAPDRVRTRRVACLETRAEAAPDLAAAAVIRARTQLAHEIVKRRAADVEGTSPVALHTCFAALGRSSVTELLARSMARAARERLGKTDLPVIGMAAPPAYGGYAGVGHFVDVPAGTVTRSTLGRLCPHDDRLAIMSLTVADLMLWLEWSTSAYTQTRPGALQSELLDLTYPPARLDLPADLTFDLDLEQAPGFGFNGRRLRDDPRRVSRVRREGRVLDPAERVIVACTDYRARNGGNLPVLPSRELIDGAGPAIRDVVAAGLRGGLARAARPVFQPVRVENAVTILETSPAAEFRLDEIADLQPRIVDRDGDGFLRIALTLDPA